MRCSKLTCAYAYAHENTPEEDPAIDVPRVFRGFTIFCQLEPIRTLKHSDGACDDDHELDAIKRSSSISIREVPKS